MFISYRTLIWIVLLVVLTLLGFRVSGAIGATIAVLFWCGMWFSYWMGLKIGRDKERIKR